MSLYLNLERYQIDELFKEVGSKKTFLRVELKLLEYLFLWTGNKPKKAPYICIDYENLHRAFLVNQDGNKVISFCFRFHLKPDSPNLTATNNSLDSIYYLGRSGIVLPRNISEAISILTEYEDREGNLYSELTFDNEDNIAPESFDLFEYLLFSEDGYIRYDYDKKNQDPIKHPLNHFDINYSEPAHFKIGLHKKIELSEFITFLDLKKICSKLDLNPIPEYLKIGVKSSRRKKGNNKRK